MDRGYLKLLGLEYYVEKQKDSAKSVLRSKIYHDIDWVVKSLGLCVELIEEGADSMQLTTPGQIAIPKVLSDSEKKALYAHLLTMLEVKHG